MKKLVLFLSLLLPGLLWAQIPGEFPNANTNGTGAPGGPCAPGSLYTDNGTGSVYSCKGGAWILSGTEGVLPTGPSSPNGIPYYATSTPSGGVPGLPTWTGSGVNTRDETASTDPILATDCIPTPVFYQGSVSVTVTLPTATSLGTSNCVLKLTNNTSGSNTTVTIQPTTWTIVPANSGLNLQILQNQTCAIFVDDTTLTQWDAVCGEGLVLAGTNVTITRTAYTTTIAATGTQTIASGATAMGTGAIGSGACASVVTVSASGVATTDAIAVTFNGDPTSTTGYTPSTNGMLTIIPYPTANNVNFKVCNNTSASITPGSVTLNWRVVR